MKKIVYSFLMSWLAVTLGLFTFSPLTYAAAPNSYALYVDGKLLSSPYPTIVQNNTTLVPMKTVLAELGYTTTLDSKTKMITAKHSSGSYIVVSAGSKTAKLNGVAVQLPVAVKAMNGTTYLPLSVIKTLTGKAIGVDTSQAIAWIGEQPTVDTLSAPWGISPEQLKKSFAGKLLIDEGGQDDIYVLLYQNAPDYDEEIYIFYKSKLAKASFMPSTTNFELAFYIGVYEGIVNSVTKTYGEPLSNTAIYDKDTLEEVSFADGGFYMSVWEVDNTKITALLKATNEGYATSLQFVDMSVEAQLNAALAAMK